MPLFLVCVVGVALSLVEGLHPGVEEDDQLFGYFGKGFKKRKTIYKNEDKDSSPDDNLAAALRPTRKGENRKLLNANWFNQKEFSE